ncbi:hypothetical protein Hypma_013109 [Hypsizygus marmoreus]|uniref:Uncharacterized protein n=1 Tax=Hypsizygus marmoreus TaxID=39966 RepID=A0A369JD42_HYPMA|nr:hypothetical protein Hypma_013109 [Hypsizygus marmoreus]
MAQLKRRCGELNAQFLRLTKQAQSRVSSALSTTKCLIHKGDYYGWCSITDECFCIPKSPPAAPSPLPVTAFREAAAVIELQHEQNHMFRLSHFRTSLLEHYTTTNPHAIFMHIGQTNRRRCLNF